MSNVSYEFTKRTPDQLTTELVRVEELLSRNGHYQTAETIRSAIYDMSMVELSIDVDGIDQYRNRMRAFRDQPGRKLPSPFPGAFPFCDS